MAAGWDNLSDPIFHHAQARPDATAVIEGNDALSYRRLAALVAQASVALREEGIAPGDRIGVALTNSIDHVVLILALLRVGANPVELASDGEPEALGAIARKYGLRTIFTEAHALAPPGVARIRLDRTWRATLAAKNGDHRCTASPDTLEILSLTTGSTGLPSGALWTQRQLMQRLALRLAVYYPQGGAALRPIDFALTISLRFSWTLVVALMQLSAGGTLILLPELRNAADLMRAIAGCDGAIVCVTANMCRAFIAAAPERGLLFPRLHLLESSGLPLYAEEKRAMMARVAPNFLESYGTASAGMIASLSSADMTRKADSVGRPLPTLALEIVDDAGRGVARGVYGRIRCRGALMSRPCPEDAGARATEYVRDGWYYPGDVGTIDSEGYLHLRGRVADTIRRGGAEFFTAEIEAALATHPLVAEVAVIGVPVSGQGHEIVAFVVARGALSHDAVAAYCRNRLAPDRLPDRIYYPNALPLIGGNKVDRLRLLEIAMEAAAKAKEPPRDVS